MHLQPVPDYELLTPPKIVFGWGRRREIGSLAARLGRRAFLVSGSRTLQANGTIEEISGWLGDESVATVSLASISREPEVADVDRAAAQLAQLRAGAGDLVLAVGGGAAIDLAKAAAAMATNTESDTVQDYLEGVGRGCTLRQPPLPVLAMPTTAGTGTEATKNAVVSSYHPPFKKSLRSELMVPRVVLVDPELTVSVPPRITASTGMDAITQLIESYVSQRARPVPQALCLQGLQLAVPSIQTAVSGDPHDERTSAARVNMAHAALLSGMALANSGLGMAHGVAAALGVHAKVSHGLACAVMLPATMRANRSVREPEFARLGRLFQGGCIEDSGSVEEASRGEWADMAVDFISRLCLNLAIPQRLSEIGVTAEQLPGIVKSSRGNSMNGNPRPLSDEELGRILSEML